MSAKSEPRRLDALQSDLARSLIDGTALPLAGSEIIPGGDLDAEGALDVYRRGYRARLTEQLGETYEAVWWVLGDEGFFDVCRRYIAEHPSSSYNLSDYGEGLADFLAAAPESTEMEALPDLARLEWRFKELFHAPEHAHVPVEELAALGDLSSVRLVLGEAVGLIESRFAIGEIFARRKEPPDAAAPFDWRRPQRLLLYKLDGQIYTKELPAGAFAVLEALRDGARVEDALVAALEADDGFGEEQASAVFELLARCGLVTSAAASASPITSTP
ncbi:MAG TPA: DNA-binding domain-containing protein [Candidatus Limnocylindrales bacterium]|nr:DNA-binding domain-containing protein [Candidatus Limnocylindrales bacterium]